MDRRTPPLPAAYHRFRTQSVAALPNPCLTRFHRFGHEIADFRGSDRRKPLEHKGPSVGASKVVPFSFRGPLQPIESAFGWVQVPSTDPNRRPQGSLLHHLPVGGIGAPGRPGAAANAAPSRRRCSDRAGAVGRSRSANRRDPQPAVHFPAGLPAREGRRRSPTDRRPSRGRGLPMTHIGIYSPSY